MKEHRTDRWLGLGLALIAAHFVWVAVNVQPAISGPDMGGYFLQAHQLVTAGRTSLVDASPLQAPAPHFVTGRDGTLYSKYPPGLPLLLAVPVWSLGSAAGLWVDPLLTAGLLLGVLLLGRRWLGPGWALVPVTVMAATPLLNRLALGGFAHTGVACLLVWSLYGLWRWQQHGGLGWAAVSGVCLGIIPTVRYAEVLFAGGLGLAFLLYARDRRHQRQTGWWRGPAVAAAAAAGPLLLLAVRNRAAFGAFWRTGYAVTREQSGFSWAAWVDHWHPYLAGLVEGNGLIFGLAVVGLGLWLARRDQRRRGLVVLALVLPTTLLYGAYYWRVDGMSQRFLLPTYPLYALAAVAPLQALAVAGRPSRIALSMLVGAQVLWGLPPSYHDLRWTRRQRAGLARATDFVRAHVDDGDVLFVEPQLSQQLQYAGRWRVADGRVLASLGRGGTRVMRRRGGGRAGVSPHLGDSGASDRPRPMGAPPRWRQRYAERYGQARLDTLRVDLGRWAGQAATYILADSVRVQVLTGGLPSATLDVVAKLHVEGGGLGPSAGIGPGAMGPPFGIGPGARRLPRAAGPGGSGTLVLLRWNHR